MKYMEGLHLYLFQIHLEINAKIYYLKLSPKQRKRSYDVQIIELQPVPMKIDDV